ncbi:MAG: cytidylyltransferase, partial [Candidatus Margulisiibacteriota bacterium]
MIAALLLGRKGSVGFPGKNTYPLLGMTMMEYPLTAALESKYVDEVYVSTDDEEIMEIARNHNAKVIVRPPELATKDA